MLNEKEGDIINSTTRKCKDWRMFGRYFHHRIRIWSLLHSKKQIGQLLEGRRNYILVELDEAVKQFVEKLFAKERTNAKLFQRDAIILQGMAKSGGRFSTREQRREKGSRKPRGHKLAQLMKIYPPSPWTLPLHLLECFFGRHREPRFAEYKLLSSLDFSDETNCSIINGRELCCSQAVKLLFLDFFSYLKK